MDGRKEVGGVGDWAKSGRAWQQWLQGLTVGDEDQDQWLVGHEAWLQLRDLHCHVLHHSSQIVGLLEHLHHSGCHVGQLCNLLVELSLQCLVLLVTLCLGAPCGTAAPPPSPRAW